MIAEIESWIASGRNYQKGVELYERYGTNSAVKVLLASGESPFSAGKLYIELTALCIKMKPKAPVRVEKPKYTVDELSPALQREYKRKGELYMKASQMHSDLFHEEDQQKRAALVKAIHSCFDEIESIWKKCDRYILERDHEHNSISGLIRKRNNLRTRISKARQKNNSDKEQDLITEMRLVESKLEALEKGIVSTK